MISVFPPRRRSLRGPTLTGGAAVTVHGRTVGVKPDRPSLLSRGPDALPVVGYSPKVGEYHDPVHQGEEMDSCKRQVEP